MKKLCVACKGLQDQILEFASHKPARVNFKNPKNGDYQQKGGEDKFKCLIEKILEFK